jgi:hypothetical protein
LTEQRYVSVQFYADMPSVVMPSVVTVNVTAPSAATGVTKSTSSSPTVSRRTCALKLFTAVINTATSTLDKYWPDVIQIFKVVKY